MSGPPQILEAYLGRVAEAVMQDDFETYADHVALPFVLVTDVTTLVVKDLAELEHGFEAFVEMLQSQGVTDYLRVVESAVLSDDGLVTGRYVSHLLRGDAPVVPAFRSRIGLRLQDDRWRAVSIANAMNNARWPILLPVVARGI